MWAPSELKSCPVRERPKNQDRRCPNSTWEWIPSIKTLTIQRFQKPEIRESEQDTPKNQDKHCPNSTQGWILNIETLTIQRFQRLEIRESEKDAPKNQERCCPNSTREWILNIKTLTIRGQDAKSEVTHLAKFDGTIGPVITCQVYSCLWVVYTQKIETPLELAFNFRKFVLYINIWEIETER